MLPIKPHFDRPPSVLEGVVPQAHVRVDPLRLDAHFPKLTGGASALAQVAAQAPGERKFGAGHWMPTLAQQHQAKVAATPSAQLVVAHTDVNGRFIDGSGRVDVGSPDFDEFPLLRRLGNKAHEGISGVLTYGLGLLDWFNPTGVIPTPEARYAMKKTQDTLASTAGFIADLATDHVATLSQIASVPLQALDAADELSRQGRDDHAAELRAEVAWELVGFVLGTRKRVGLSFSESKRPSLPLPKVDVSDQIILVHSSRRGSLVKYEYEVSKQHFLKVTIKDGILSDYIWADPNLRATHGGGRDMLLSLMRRLEKDGVQVRGVQQEWLRGVGDNHRDYVLSKQVRGMTSAEAAKSTWSGNFWSKLGYDKVRIDKESDYGVVLYFE